MASTGTAHELLARASSRQPVQPEDARVGAVFERIVVGSDSYFVKQLSAASDWITRVSGDHACRPCLVWQSGIMDRSQDCIDHTVAAMDRTGTGDDAELTVVMRDVGRLLVPPGDAIVSAGQHARFIVHMAALSPAFWDWDDNIGLTAMAERVRFFAPDGHRCYPQLRDAFTTTPESSPPACPSCHGHSCTATGRSATWAATPKGAPSSSTGPRSPKKGTYALLSVRQAGQPGCRGCLCRPPGRGSAGPGLRGHGSGRAAGRRSGRGRGPSWRRRSRPIPAWCTG